MITHDDSENLPAPCTEQFLITRCSCVHVLVLMFTIPIGSWVSTGFSGYIVTAIMV